MLQETLHAQSCTLLTQLVNVNQIKQPNCCHSFHLVSCGDLRLGGGVGGWDNICGRNFWEMPTELLPGRNAWWKKCQWRSWCCLVSEMKCQLLPDPSKWDHPMHTRPIPSFSDEPFHALKKGWNIQCGQDVQKSGKSGPKMSDRKIERLWKIKMSTDLRVARKVTINHKALKPNKQKHSICLAVQKKLDWAKFSRITFIRW